MTVALVLAQSPAVPSPTTSAVVTIGLALMSLLGTAGVGVYTARSTRRAADASSKIEAAKLDAQRVDSFRGDLDQLRGDRVEDRRIFAEEMARIRTQHAEEVERWRRRVTQLDERAQATSVKLDELSAWARQIRRLMHAPAVVAAIIESGQRIPPVPRGFGLLDTDPGWRRVLALDTPSLPPFDPGADPHAPGTD